MPTGVPGRSNAQKTGIKDGSVAEASKKRRDAETDTRYANRGSGLKSNVQCCRTLLRQASEGRKRR